MLRAVDGAQWRYQTHTAIHNALNEADTVQRIILFLVEVLGYDLARICADKRIEVERRKRRFNQVLESISADPRDEPLPLEVRLEFFGFLTHAEWTRLAQHNWKTFTV